MIIQGKTTGVGAPGENVGEQWIVQVIGRTVYVPTSTPEADIESVALQKATRQSSAEVSEYIAARERIQVLDDFTPTTQLVEDLVTIIKVLQT